MFKNQLEMFEYIWDTRDHVSELSGLQLYPPGHMLFVQQFAHVLNKGSYPAWKLNPDNIMLIRPEEHATQERYDLFKERHDELKRLYYDTVVNSHI